MLTYSITQGAFHMEEKKELSQLVEEAIKENYLQDEDIVTMNMILFQIVIVAKMEEALRDFLEKKITREDYLIILDALFKDWEDHLDNT